MLGKVSSIIKTFPKNSNQYNNNIIHSFIYQ